VEPRFQARKSRRAGRAALHRYAKDAEPLIVLTTAAAVKLALPEHLEDYDKPRRHLPDDHPVVKLLVKGGWRLTGRGFGAWTGVHRTAGGGVRQGVRLAIVPWALGLMEQGHSPARHIEEGDPVPTQR
jgi:hypothetical protein